VTGSILHTCVQGDGVARGRTMLVMRNIDSLI
jgi:hypothetical protein